MGPPMGRGGQPPHIMDQNGPGMAAPVRPGLNPGDETSKWLYLDDKGTVQGPWTTSQMRSWFEKKMLSIKVRIRLESDPPQLFLPLGTRPAAFKHPPGATVAHPPRLPRMPVQSRPPPPNPNGNPARVNMAMQSTLDPVSALSQTLDQIDSRTGGPPTQRQQQTPWGSATGPLPFRPNPFQGRDSMQIQNRPYAATASFNKRSGRFSASGQQKYFERMGVPENRAERMMSHYFDHDNWQDQMNRARRMQQQQRAKKKFKR